MKKSLISERYRTLALCAGVFVLALIVRAWTNTWLTDFWGDSYHHWLITRLTMLNGGIYSDYKGLETVWSPLYHYLSMMFLLLVGSDNIVVLHGMNTLFGSLACAATSYLAWKLFKNRLAAIASGVLLAFMTWHIAFSGMNVTEIVSGLLVLAITIVVVVKRKASFVLLFLLALAMPLTRTELSVYLAIVVLWLVIQKRYAQATAISSGVAIALLAWSLWSLFKTGNFLHWYEQYAQNNLHDWALLNPASPNAAFAFADYLNRLSPWVLPALVGGLLYIVAPVRRGRRAAIWLVSALLAGHSLFLIVGFARGIVPLLTERYLVIDLPLAAVLMGAWVAVLGKRMSAWVPVQVENPTPAEPHGHPNIFSALVALVLIATTFFRFQNDIPELQIRRWAIDPEWQIGNFLYAHVQPGDVVLTDAPVAIYRSGKPVSQFVSSVALGAASDPQTALKTNQVRWIVTQPASYDAASNFVPRQLLERQTSGVVNGLSYDLVWRYDPQKTDIQSEVWHVSKVGD